MCRSLSTVAALVLSVGMMAVAPARGASDPNALCHRHVVRQLEKYKKTHLKLYRNCLDKENRHLISGDCLDTVSAAKLALTNTKVSATIAKKCTMTNLATLGYRSDCQYGPSTAGIGGTCFALPVTTPTEFAECMKCWKGAEFARYVGTLYASHAQEVCGAALDDTSATCSAIGCTTPPPDQRDLGDNSENDCQRGLSKAALNYLLKREHILEQCLLKLGSLPTCLSDPKIQLKLANAEAQKETLVKKFCGNRKPVASPPFCCRTGMGQMCSAAVDRNDCITNLSGTVQEGKFCNAGTCDNNPGPNKPITWWEHCPTNQPCPGPTLGDIDGVIGCVDTVADQLVGGLLCLQFPGTGAGACPTPTPTATPTPTVTPTP